MKRKRIISGELMNSILAVLPALVVFIIFTYLPLFKNILYSFTDYDGFSKNYRIIGIENFVNIMKDGEVLKAFFNTLYFSLGCVILAQTIPLILALILNKNLKGRNFYKTIFYLPCVISPLIIAYTWNSFLQYTGVINEFLRVMHMEQFIYDWLGSTKTAMPLLIFINQWQWTGYSMVIFLAGISSIPEEICEAAMLDGIAGLKKLRYITLPLIMPSITISLFLSLVGTLKIFDLPFIMTGGGPIQSTLSITMCIFNNMFDFQRFGYASSIGVVFFIFIAIVTLIQLRITRRMEVEY